jgi:hypothetical protein
MQPHGLALIRVTTPISDIDVSRLLARSVTIDPYALASGPEEAVLTIEDPPLNRIG